MGNPYEAKRKVHFETQVKSTPGAETGVAETTVTSLEPPAPALGVAELSVANALELVGDDKELAQAALSEEREGKNRSTLISGLEDILNG